MNYRRRYLCLILAFLMVLFPACRKIAPAVEPEIVAVLQAAQDGWNRGDLDAYMQCYWHSPRLRFAGRDEVNCGWEAVLAGYRSAYPDRSAMGRLFFADLDVTVIDPDNALVFGRWRLERADDQPHGLFSLHLKRIDGQWLIVSDHTSSGDPDRSAAEATITACDLLERVAFLSSREMAGRLPGTPQFTAAARAMADRFAELGLVPGGEDGFFQHLLLESNLVLPGCRLALLAPPGEAGREYVLDRDYVFRGFTGSGEVTAPVVFCGYGLSLSARGYDDYGDVDVAGKVVLAFKQAPPWQLEDGGWDGQDLPRAKARTALEHGAVAVLLVSRPKDARPQPLIGSVYHGGDDRQVPIPQLQVSPAVAMDLLGETDQAGPGLAGLQTLIDETRRPASRSLPQRVSIAVRTEYQKAADSMNVVGILPGCDPDLKDECLVLGAHLDHVGTLAGEACYHGANDNASGAAAVVETAEAFVQGGVRPRRSVVFVLFTGEEQGLIGSTFHAGHPVFPLEKTVAMINMDCVAHGDSIQVGGGKSAPELWGLARSLDRDGSLLMTAATWGGGGADATPFHRQGVPTLYFASRYSYTHLHRTTDTVETLNGKLYQALVRLAYRTAAAIADGRYQREEIAP